MKTLSKYPRNKRTGPGLRVPASNISKWRFLLVRYGLYGFVILLVIRLAQVQIMDSGKYQKLAEQQYNKSYSKKAARGLIFDRTGVELALNKPSYDLGISKRQLGSSLRTSHKLAQVLDWSSGEIAQKIDKGGSYFLLARKLDQHVADEIRKLGLVGVKLIESTERRYPLRATAAQVVGFADVDGKGLSGIELEYNDHLRGKDGSSVLQKDATGKGVVPIPAFHEEIENGDHVTLTIDNVIQTIVEEELSLTMARFHAKGGSVIVIAPQTGEILAIASRPGFDANHPALATPEQQRIRPVTDIFEPGSTFKIVTLMAALLAGVQKQHKLIDCENGTFRLFGETIRDSKSYGKLPFDDVFKYSSNIGTAKIATILGRESLYKAARSFGFGNETGIGLPGEVAGILKRPTSWSRFSIAAISYGHEVAATTLQMAMAYGAIANGGFLMKPAIVKTIGRSDGKILFRREPQVIRRVMAASIARRMTDILVAAVDSGTGTAAKIEHLEIAGKTGTAQKPRSDGKGYSESKFVACFAGFYPAHAAQYLFYINIDEPNPVHSGGMVAAPLFRKILTRILDVYNRPLITTAPPSTQMQSIETKNIPDLRGRRSELAKRVLSNLGIDYQVIGSGIVVKDQRMTDAHETASPPKLSIELADSHANRDGYLEMPDLIGLTKRKAVSELSFRGLHSRLFGIGIVKKQTPSAGSRVRVGTRAILEFQPRTEIKQFFKQRR